MNENMDLTDNECQLNSCLFFSLSKVSRALKKEADDRFSVTGLSPSHAFILYIVCLKQRIHQKEVGDYLMLTPSTVTRFVEKLESKKLVIKEVEGKNVYLCATSQGEELKTHVMKAWDSLNKVINSTLSDEEKKIYIELNNKILAHYD
jgi:DNA-binding MarR family transcriptional regulator